MKRKILVLASVLALVVALAVPMTALAVTTDDTDVSGSIPADVLEITPPSAISLGDLYGTTGDVSGTSATPGTVLSTYVGGYNLTIKSDDATGYMGLGGQAGADLAAVLKVTPSIVTDTGATVTNAGLTGVTVVTATPQEVGTTSAPAPETGGTNSITLTVEQPRQTTGTTGAYSYILTWTVTSN